MERIKREPERREYEQKLHMLEMKDKAAEKAILARQKKDKSASKDRFPPVPTTPAPLVSPSDYYQTKNVPPPPPAPPSRQFAVGAPASKWPGGGATATVTAPTIRAQNANLEDPAKNLTQLGNLLTKINDEATGSEMF